MSVRQVATALDGTSYLLESYLPAGKAILWEDGIRVHQVGDSGDFESMAAARDYACRQSRARIARLNPGDFPYVKFVSK